MSDAIFPSGGGGGGGARARGSLLGNLSHVPFAIDHLQPAVVLVSAAKAKGQGVSLLGIVSHIVLMPFSHPQRLSAGKDWKTESGWCTASQIGSQAKHVRPV